MAADEDDALYVLTAVLLTPARFPGVLGDDYPEACSVLGLEPYAEGYGLVLGQDGAGARWTVATEDVTLAACAIAAWDCGMEYDLSPDEHSVAAVLPGWPVAVAVAAPGVPAPHDPAPDADAHDGWQVLTPPDDASWGPAQRRMGADEIALQWSAWRERIDDASVFADAEADLTTGSATPGDVATPSDSGPSSPVQRVMLALRAYLEDPPPAGRVRSSFASGEARILRCDGPGWSMVARTDDIAFLLLDEEPGEVTPVGRGRSLPALLDALAGIAVRPAA
ncbi:hypothetical protein N566_15220 [Streptomycetaceae bacterium MP113-05]|nr:hypothetical protein N566_15220 [Streptomycetaceae bacterium MP113-05]